MENRGLVGEGSLRDSKTEPLGKFSYAIGKSDANFIGDLISDRAANTETLVSALSAGGKPEDAAKKEIS